MAGTAIASGPGLIVPLMVFPSQVMTIVMCVRCVAPGPQSPDQVPVRGCPSCAAPGMQAQRDECPDRESRRLSHRGNIAPLPVSGYTVTVRAGYSDISGNRGFRRHHSRPACPDTTPSAG